MPISLFVSTPCYGGVCLQAYAESLLRLQRTCVANGIHMLLDTTENESLVHRARNLAVARFYQKTKAEYFMFIDADIHFDPESVIRLIKSDHDVSVAAYPKKCVMWDQVEQGVKTNDTRDPAKLSASLVMNFKYQNTQIVNGFAEVLDGPTGFMVIKRDVFTKMFEHYTALNCKNDHQNRDFEDYCAVFDCMIDPETRRYLSEDYAFCRRWQQMGGKIYADCMTVLGHVGNLRFHGVLEERIKALAV
jgi:glycosyltransferase involved in cell wall biosynthesis